MNVYRRTGTHLPLFIASNGQSEYTASGATGDLFTDLIVDIPVQNSTTVVRRDFIARCAQGANDKSFTLFRWL